MTWAPGLPVVTDTDRAEWQQWRKDRKREQQRQHAGERNHELLVLVFAHNGLRGRQMKRLYVR